MTRVMETVRRLLGGRKPPRGTDFYDSAERAGRIPEAELAVAEAALAGGGALANRFVRQLREAGHVWRRFGDDGDYELRISTIHLVRDVPRAGWMSGWMPLATDAGRSLELRLVVSQAGIIELAGRTGDGQRWPERWHVRPADLDRIRAAAPWLDLPTPAGLRAARADASRTIGEWLGDPEALRGRRGVVRADPPASDERVAGLQSKEGFALPAAYRSLLLVADGIEVGPIVVLGTSDAYRLDVPGPARLVIAPPDEDGALVIDEAGQVIRYAREDETADGKVVASDLRQWLLSVLRRSSRVGARPEGSPE